MQPYFELEFTFIGVDHSLTLPLLLPSPHCITNYHRVAQVAILESLIKIFCKPRNNISPWTLEEKPHFLTCLSD